MIFGRRGASARWLVLGIVCLQGWLMAGFAAQMTPNLRDTLVYKDGDRVQGVLVQEADGIIVFRSDRFGELRISSSHAVVIKADKAPTEVTKPATAVTSPPVGATPAEVASHAVKKAHEAEEEERVTIWDRFSPSVLTAKVRNYFGPWHGRLSFATEVVSDVADRSNSSYEGHLQRKWKTDEVQFNARYDYAETNNLVTTDLVKTSGQWRHEFNKDVFAQYRPTSEWNRASQRRGVPNDYVLLQQEIGAGYHVLTKPTRKMRVGVSQNFFDTWNTGPVADHVSRGIVSTFEETEFALPWRITISQRGVYYPVREGVDGWENRVDLNKKLTETLSTSLRHEIRRNNPDGTAQDYTRLKLLFGLDF